MDLDLGDTRLILAECERRGVLRNQAAYILATAYWETARTMKPVEEAYYLQAKNGWSDKRMDQWRRENLRYYPWHGRGYPQLTWERNYRKASKETGVDLIADPSRAMDPDVAVPVLIAGMLEGWFTGKKLSDYVTLQRSDYVNARRIVNGTDKAGAIAELAREYEADLLSEGYGVEAPPPEAETEEDDMLAATVIRHVVGEVIEEKIGGRIMDRIRREDPEPPKPQAKSALESKTTFGLVLAAIPLIGNLDFDGTLGVVENFEQNRDTILALASMAFAFFGRVVAKGPLKFGK